MKRPMQRMACLLAVLLSLSTLSACGKGEPGAEGTASAALLESQESMAVETNSLEDTLAELRKKVNWGGKDFGVLYLTDINGYTEEVEAKEKAGDDTSSAVINDAVWERNSLFEEYCNLNFVMCPTTTLAVSTALQGEVQTGSGDFHIINQTTSETAKAATGGYLYDYLSLESIDYEEDWWDEGTLNFALGGKVFFMNGPFNIVDDDVTFVIMFNKQLREDYKVANPYDTVKSNEWTLEYFNSIISILATENGDGKWDHNDTYGFSSPGSIGNTFFYGAGLQYVANSRSMEKPELVLSDAKMERALDTLKIARSIVHDNNSSYVARIGDEALSLEVFMQGRSLFYCEATNYLRTLNSSMETEYGILPIPKYATSQEHYTTWSHSIGSTMSIPTSVARGDIEQFSYVLETYAILSQKLVRPAYYDTMLTVRNVHDAESAEMVDLIFAHRIYDMAMYFTDFGFNGLFEISVRDADNFSSSYKTAASVFQKRIDRMMENMEKVR